MGNGNWSAADWDRHAAGAATRTRAELFGARRLDAALDPARLKGGLRESLDSPANPASTPIIVTCDVTGSMGITAEIIVRSGLGVIMQGIYDRKPVTDPHVLIGATGDVYCDQAPLQVSQFEADMRLVDQVKKIWIEGGGGGNLGESYNAPWYFAAMKTRCDAILKRGRKGYLFTIGDEPPLPVLPRDAIRRVFGDAVERDISSRELLDLVTRDWEVFHLIVKPVSSAVADWKALLRERAIEVPAIERLGEVIVSTMQVIEGADPGRVAASWDGGTALVVAKAVGGLVRRGSVPQTGLVRL